MLGIKSKFESMKWLSVVVLFPFFLILFSCEDEEKNELVRKFKANRFNLIFNQKVRFGDISCKIPEGFKPNGYSDYTIQPKAKVYLNSALGIHFTMERFSTSANNMNFVTKYQEKNEIYFAEGESESEINWEDQLNLIHNAYVFKRYSTLTNGSISIKKNTSKKVRFEGVIQVVSGQSEYGEGLYYTTASILIDQTIYVFQFITTHEMMDYVYDDFERLLASVHLVK